MVERESDAAAEEAAEIGGEVPQEESLEEAERPLAEGGEGYAEGFEEAERDLVEHASHGDQPPDPSRLAGEPEPDRGEAEYAEPDRVESTERSEEGQEGRELGSR